MFFLSLSRISESEKKTLVRNLIDRLPDVNRQNLAYLMNFLHEVLIYSDVNRMSANNLAICLGPNLLWQKSSASLPTLTSFQSGAEFGGFVINTIVEVMITHFEDLFPPGMFSISIMGFLR